MGIIIKLIHIVEKRPMVARVRISEATIGSWWATACLLNDEFKYSGAQAAKVKISGAVAQLRWPSNNLPICSNLLLQGILLFLTEF